MRCAPFSYLCSYNQMRVDYLRLRMRHQCHATQQWMNSRKPTPICQHLHICKRKLCTTMKSSNQIAFQGRGTFGRGGFSHLPFDYITSEEPLYQIIKKFNYVKYIGKVIIRKIMSSCLGVADFCQTYNQQATIGMKTISSITFII